MLAHTIAMEELPSSVMVKDSITLPLTPATLPTRSSMPTLAVQLTILARPQLQLRLVVLLLNHTLDTLSILLLLQHTGVHLVQLLSSHRESFTHQPTLLH